jgi:predicted N-formylglutamate amidohydrolase
MRGLMNTGIKIHHNLISDPAGQKAWADRLAQILAAIEATLSAEKLV